MDIKINRILYRDKLYGCWVGKNIGITPPMSGEGDFLQSLIYAINCGDDSDCKGATVGAILGIIGGDSSIPS